MRFTQQNIRNGKTILKNTFVFTVATALFLSSCKKNDLQPADSDIPKNKKENSQSSRELDLKMVAANFASPIFLTEAPDNSKRLFVVDQPGQIWIIDKNGQKLSQTFLDISTKMVSLGRFYDERGLLGLAFHPDFKWNRKFYLFYTAPPPAGGPTTDAGNTGLPKVWNNTTRISEFMASASNPNVADMSSERILLQAPHPQANHNGGTIAFGSDGYLYISIGDGGNKNDIGPGHVEDWYAVNAGGNAQNIEANFMGKILRIDVNASSDGKAYAIPNSNPFVGKTGLDEIYAYGFRNPYRFSFDMSGSRRLFVGDAGQNLYEEVSVVSKGGNYGWNVKEGTHCFNAANERVELASCPDEDVWGNRLVDPVIEAPNIANPQNGHFVTVIGGNVYRGNDIPGLQGDYLFANFSTSTTSPTGEIYISHANGNTNRLWSYEKLSLKSFGDHIGHYIKGFGQDQDGEIYVLGSTVLGPIGNTGKVFKLIGEKKHD
jgi:glucose/arabinose dehydrogenase